MATKTLVRTEGLLTQLVFDHSLRIRLKAEASNEKVEGDDLDDTGISDSAPTAENTAISSKSDERVNEPSEASTTSLDPPADFRSIPKGHIKGKDKDDPLILKSDTKPVVKDKNEAQNLIGKINNLVTTDLGNIVDGRDFLLIGML